jgi:hypothetical protein
MSDDAEHQAQLVRAWLAGYWQAVEDCRAHALDVPSAPRRGGCRGWAQSVLRIMGLELR